MNLDLSVGGVAAPYRTPLYRILGLTTAAREFACSFLATGTETVAAKPGDVLILWGTGFGRTNPAVEPGVLVPAGIQYNCAPATVKLGPADARVFGCALSPGFAGLYQVAIQVPSSLSDSDYPLKVTVGGVSSPDGVVLSVT